MEPRTDEEDRRRPRMQEHEEKEMRERNQKQDMSEFIALAEHRRVMLRETVRTTALLRRVERARSVAQDDDEERRDAHDEADSETVAAAGLLREVGRKQTPHRRCEHSRDDVDVMEVVGQKARSQRSVIVPNSEINAADTPHSHGSEAS